eukprot:m.450266 g.450266  ORF g.450266 m.450266 type:complete len:583 (+) comp19954_c0_seq1:39-1787(+)
MAHWDMTKASRAEHQARAAELKASGRPGDFFIRGRPKSGPANSLGLTICTGGTHKEALANFLIEQSNAGFQVRGGDALFRSLADLVTYYALSPKAPLNIKLAEPEATNEYYLNNQLDDEDENYGFADEDDLGLGRLGNGALGAVPTFQTGPAVRHTAPRGPPAKIPAPSVDMASLSKIEMLRKQAEILAAKRRAAEMNVRMLSDNGPPGVVNPQVRREEEAASRERMEAEMLEMRNAGALAAWQTQIEEIDRLRARTRATAQRQTQPQQPAGLPPRTNVDGSVHRLYEEVGLYSNSFAAKVKQVEAAEAQLKAEEERMATLAAVSELVRVTLDRLIEGAVTQVEVSRQEHEAQSVEEKYRETQRLAEERNAQLNEVAQAFARASSVLGGAASSVLGHGAGGPPPQQQQLYHHHHTAGAAAAPNGFAPYATYATPAVPPSRGAGPQGGVYNTLPGVADPRLYETPAVPQYGGGGGGGNGTAASASAANASLQALAQRASSWQRTQNAGSEGSDDDEAQPAVTSTWRSPGASRRPPAQQPPPETFATFSIVKRKPPPGREANVGGVEEEQQCSYLGNCTCPRCR